MADWRYRRLTAGDEALVAEVEKQLTAQPDRDDHDRFAGSQLLDPEVRRKICVGALRAYEWIVRLLRDDIAAIARSHSTEVDHGA